MDFCPSPLMRGFGACRAAERPIDIRRRHEKRKTTASARAGSCTVAGYISPPHVSRAGNRGISESRDGGK